MARGYTTRKLEVWSLHARDGDGAVKDYKHLFRQFADLNSRYRVWEDDEKAVAIPTLAVKGQKVRLTAYEGPRGQPIIFQTADGTERTERLDPGEIVATRTHVLIDLPSREAIIEYNHRGAKAGDIAAVLGTVGRKHLQLHGLFVDFSPKVDRSFIEGIDSFQRIRVAGFRISRPNSDWNDWSETFSRSAADSDAHTAQAEYTAPRGKSLARNSGVIPFIKARASDGATALKNAFVVGKRSEEAPETKITLGDHKEHQRVAVRLDADKHVDEADIERRLVNFDSERRGSNAD